MAMKQDDADRLVEIANGVKGRIVDLRMKLTEFERENQTLRKMVNTMRDAMRGIICQLDDVLAADEVDKFAPVHTGVSETMAKATVSGSSTTAEFIVAVLQRVSYPIEGLDDLIEEMKKLGWKSKSVDIKHVVCKPMSILRKSKVLLDLGAGCYWLASRDIPRGWDA